jgi:hypothetical protein
MAECLTTLRPLIFTLQQEMKNDIKEWAWVAVKLLPPIIEGTIPAFYSINGMVSITIPFSMNRAVSNN